MKDATKSELESIASCLKNAHRDKNSALEKLLQLGFTNSKITELGIRSLNDEDVRIRQAAANLLVYLVPFKDLLNLLDSTLPSQKNEEIVSNHEGNAEEEVIVVNLQKTLNSTNEWDVLMAVREFNKLGMEEPFKQGLVKLLASSEHVILMEALKEIKFFYKFGQDPIICNILLDLAGSSFPSWIRLAGTPSTDIC
jgi:hypothetical protein